MSMRVAIVGQSNAILSEGFVHQLVKEEGIQIGNMGRLGASPSVLLPYFVDGEFLAGHDVAIFDLAIVDQGFLWAGALDPYLIVQWLEYAITRAHAAGCIPILLLLPHRAVIPGDASAPVPLLQQLYRSVALRNSALCFDLFDAIRRRGAGNPSALDSIYSDPDHLSKGFSREVASQLARMIRRVARTPVPREPTFTALKRFERIRLAEFDGVRTTRLESSLFSGEFATLEAGQPLSLDIGSAKQIAAVLIDRAGSRGNLKITGSETVVKTIGTTSDSHHAFVAQLVPVLGLARERDGLVTLEAIANDVPTTEASWQGEPSADPRIRIAELLIERGSSAMTYGMPALTPEMRATDWFKLRT